MSLKLSRWLHRRGFSRRKLRGTLIHRHFGEGLLAKEQWSLQTESVARSWLIGIPITIIPFLPLQTFIAVPLAIVFRANVPITFALQWLSNPFTAIIQLPACYYFGCLALNQAPSRAFQEIIDGLPGFRDFGRLMKTFFEEVWTHPWDAAKHLFLSLFGQDTPGIWSMPVRDILLPLYFGALLLGIIIGVVGYFLIKAYWPKRPVYPQTPLPPVDPESPKL